MMIYAGTASTQLTQDIVNKLGISAGNIKTSRFSDGETHVELLDNVRGKDVFIVQSTCAPTNDNLMELLIISDALYRASAGRITAVMPYYGYARQDRRTRSQRIPITAKLVADMITSSRVDRVLTIDLHSEQIQGFFELPVDNIYAVGVLARDVIQQNYTDISVVSPDAGGAVRARALAKLVGDNVGMAIIDKRRPKPNVSAIMHLMGDVEGKTCIIIDDIIDTAGTLCHAAEALKNKGAKAVVAYATHAVLSGKAVVNIEESALDEVVVTNTIPMREVAQNSTKIRQLSVADILADTIDRINRDESVSELFIEEV
ncbi:MAG TPA: ribose-phosphate pyrophosphokinase [Thiothrix sp.]|nr:ribose-phosphate pyrophosphokinase [Thiothrix sp.]